MSVVSAEIFPDRSSYLPGAVVSGQIVLQLASSIKIERAVMHLTQTEKAKVRTYGIFTSRGEQTYCLLTQHILRPTSPSHPPIVLKTGSLRLPFSFQLSKTAPPSFTVDKSNFCKATLSFLVVTLDQAELRWSRDIEILPVFAPIVSYDSVLKRNDVALFLKPRHAIFDKNHPILVDWAIDNRSLAKVKQLHVSLHRKTVIRTDRGTSKQISQTLCEKSIGHDSICPQSKALGCMDIDLSCIEGLTYSVPSSSPVVNRLSSKCILTKYVTIDYIVRLLVTHRGYTYKLKVPVFIVPLNTTPLPTSPTIVISRLKARLSANEFRLQSMETLATSHELEIERLKEKLKKPADDGVCCICLTNDASVIFIPCGHLCICKGCDTSLTKRICPLCRCRIERTYVAYK